MSFENYYFGVGEKMEGNKKKKWRAVVEVVLIAAVAQPWVDLGTWESKVAAVPPGLASLSSLSLGLPQRPGLVVGVGFQGCGMWRMWMWDEETLAGKERALAGWGNRAAGHRPRLLVWVSP